MEKTRKAEIGLALFEANIGVDYILGALRAIEESGKKPKEVFLYRHAERWARISCESTDEEFWQFCQELAAEERQKENNRRMAQAQVEHQHHGVNETIVRDGETRI